METLTKQNIKNAFKQLKPRERKVIIQRLNSKTLAETAKGIGVKSTGHAHQIENKAWNSLFERLAPAS